MSKKKELEIIKLLSQRMIDAQQHIRILNMIKWDESVKADFLKHNGTRLPKVDADYYKNKPLPFTVDEKREEFRFILRDAQNQLGQYSAITRLIKRLCDEYVKAVQMLSERGTPVFCELAMELYGSPDDAFYLGGPRMSEMGVLLSRVLTALDVQLQTEADEKRYNADEAQVILQERLSNFFDKHPNKMTVMVSDDMLVDASAGAETIKLSQRVRFSDRDLRYLEVHEGWVHVGTTMNGNMQPYCSFLSKGSPSSSATQEGLAVLTEVVSLASYPGRVRRITNRVVGIDKVTKGADFLDIYHYFLSCGMDAESSYHQSVRIFRGSTPTGGPFTRDLCYAKGFVLIYNFIRFAISEHRIDAIPLLFAGKVVLEDLPLLSELQTSGLIIPPVYLPPAFRDLSALSAWMSFSLFLNKFDLNEIQKHFKFLLV